MQELFFIIFKLIK